MSIKTLLSSPGVAIESDDVEDLFNYDAKISTLNTSVLTTEKRSLIGIIGGYGQGKSVMLNKYKKQYASDPKESIWIHFDAWKYPDRSDLWEGFILDFVRQYNPTMFSTVIKLLDGIPTTKWKPFLEGSLEMIPEIGKGASKIFAGLTATSPAKRIFEIQNLFVELLKKENKRIYVVVEDADRSGRTGIYFIETLSHFLKNLPVDVEIKVFVPISDSSYKNAENHEAYVKALDIREEFIVTSRDMAVFVEAIMNSEVLKFRENRENLVELFQRMLNQHKVSIRELKAIIRQAEITFQKHLDHDNLPDPVITLALEASKYIPYGVGGSADESVFSHASVNRVLSPITLAGMIIISQNQGTTLVKMSQILSSLPGGSFAQNLKFGNGDEVVGKFTHTPNSESETYLAVEKQGRFWLPIYYIDSYN